MLKKKTKTSWLMLALLLVASVAALPLSRNDNVATVASSGVRTVQSYFDAGKGVYLTPNVALPGYVNDLSSDSVGGLYVESPEGGTVTYNNLIDVTKLTAGDQLLEVQFTPKTGGVAEMKQLLIRLEDSLDPRVFMEISLYRYAYTDVAYESITFVTVKTDTVEEYKSSAYSAKAVTNQSGETTGYTISRSVSTDVRHGTGVYASMAGVKRGHSNSVKLYFDNAALTLWTANSSDWPDNVVYNYAKGTYAQDVPGFDYDDDGGKGITRARLNQIKVVDLDDPTYMGIMKNYLWSGFPSGKARMSFTARNLIKDTASYMILAIDGQKMNGMLIQDKTAPELTVCDNGRVASPNAVVGKFYPFYEAYSIDKMYGEIEVQKTVKAPGGNVLICTGDGFTPAVTGDYTVTYTATDGSGNYSDKEYTVTAVAEAPELNGLLEDETFYDSAKALYMPVTLPEMTASGGSGDKSVDVKVAFDGKNVALDGMTFAPQNAGIYKVTYAVTDFIGQQKVYVYSLDVEMTDVPFLHETVLPGSVIAGKPLLLPAVSADLYTVWKQKIDTFNKITVEKADGTKIAEFTGNTPAVWTPREADGKSVTVIYSAAASANATPVTKRYSLNILSGDKIKDRFDKSDGVTVKENALSLEFDFDGDDETVGYINPLAVHDGIRMTFTVPAEVNAFDKVRFAFVDRYDRNKALEVSVIKGGEGSRTSYLSVNGSAYYVIAASFYGDVVSDFVFTVKKDGTVLDYNDDVAGTAKDFDFPSGFAYLYFSVEGTEEGKAAGVSLKQIKNQRLGDMDGDFIRPTVTVFDEPSGEVGLGEYLDISAAVAADVYDIKTSLSVRVISQGKTVYSFDDGFGVFDGHRLFMSDYGTYTLEYEATDLSGNTATKRYNVEVRDRIAPVLEIGEMPSVAEAGKALPLPAVVATDNVETKLTVYVIVIDPRNVYTVMTLDEEYTPKLKGRYIVKFYCEDKSYNTVYSGDYIISVQ